MRLDKYLAETAQCTRSEAKALLSKGRVQVNGAVCKKGDTQLRETDTVAVDGKALNYQQFVYIMLNKPEGVVSASTDKRDTTVVDLVGDAYPRRQLFPAGRLDKTSTGFVLLTDDGTFAHDILAPKRHVSKTYTVVLDTPLTEQMRTGFAAGRDPCRRHSAFACGGDGPFCRWLHCAGGAQAGRIPPDQADVRRVRRRRERPAPGCHRRPCTRPGPCTGPVAGAFCRRSVKNFQLTGSAFHPNFKKATHFSGRIGGRTTQKGTFLVQNGP